MEKRLGFIGIIVEERAKNAPAVNQLLSDHSEMIVGRMGLPNASKGRAVIVLIVDATTDDVGALTGKLGKLPGVSVKSGLSKN